MSSESKTFFKNLKEVTRKIANDVGEIQSSFECLSSDKQPAARRVQQLQDRIECVKEKACALKEEIAPKFSQLKNYCCDYKELALELDFQISQQEKYLSKFGYVPYQEDVVASQEASEKEDDNVKEEKGKDEEKNQLTPVLSGFATCASETKVGEKDEEENGQRTPVLSLKIRSSNVSCLPVRSSTEDMMGPGLTALNSKRIQQENEANEAKTPETPVLNIRKISEAQESCASRRIFSTPTL